MFLMNSSNRQDQVSKAHRDKIIKDVFKVCFMVVGLKLAAYAVKKIE